MEVSQMNLTSWYLRTAMAMTWATIDLTVLAAMARRLRRHCVRFSYNLLGQLLQFSCAGRRMSIGVALVFACPDLPWFAQQICRKKILRTASIEVHGFTMTSQVWLYEMTRLAPFVPRLFVCSERLRQRCIHIVHFWPLDDTCKTLLSVGGTEDRTFQGSMDRNVGIVSCRHLSGSLTLRLWDSLEPGSQQKPRSMRSEEYRSKESKVIKSHKKKPRQFLTNPGWNTGLRRVSSWCRFLGDLDRWNPWTGSWRDMWEHCENRVTEAKVFSPFQARAFRTALLMTLTGAVTQQSLKIHKMPTWAITCHIRVSLNLRAMPNT